MISADKILVCRDCNKEFAFTAGEQEFYQQRGLLHAPSRCADCRAARKGGGARPNGGGYAGDQGSTSSYDRGYNDRGSYGSREPRQMFTATCDACGREAQVPFQPTSGKPVYCSDCFAQRRSERY